MSFTKLLDWIIRNEHDYDEDGIIDDGYDYDPDSYWKEITVRGEKYIIFDYSNNVMECVHLTLSHLQILNTPPVNFYIQPPQFPESLGVFSDYEFKSPGWFYIREDLEDYAYMYINCRAKVRRKLLAYRIEDLIKRCSIHEQSILRIVLFHLPNLDINYHHPIE